MPILTVKSVGTRIFACVNVGFFPGLTGAVCSTLTGGTAPAVTDIPQIYGFVRIGPQMSGILVATDLECESKNFVRRMQTVRTIAQLRLALKKLRESADPIGLVPTMGALHDGHLSLVRTCQHECPATVVTIFVNPAQFGPGEDLTRYPRSIEADVQKLADLKVDVAFLPAEDEIYPAGFSTYVEPPQVSKGLEGEFRDTHFRGVATVVLKLFNLTGTRRAYFGQKDYQQALVIRHMVRDLDLPVEICICPIVRDTDGLALSSRNIYLSDLQRQAALALIRTLRQTEQSIRQGENDGRALMAQMNRSLIAGGVTAVDYAVVADTETLVIQETVRFPLVMLIAAHVDQTRLIDNMILQD